MKKRPLPRSYYQHEDVLFLSRDLLGKSLYTKIDGQLTGGLIVETEAYRAPEDRASHAFNNRRTPRNRVMFEAGGVAYIYICYGIHHLFNIVTHSAGVPHAILIRAIEPTQGTNVMLHRREKSVVARNLTGGPGALTQALGIKHSFNGSLLTGPHIWLEEGPGIEEERIICSPRVGIDYAKEDALLPWRFRIKDSMWSSSAK